MSPFCNQLECPRSPLNSLAGTIFVRPLFQVVLSATQPVAGSMESSLMGPLVTSPSLGYRVRTARSISGIASKSCLFSSYWWPIPCRSIHASSPPSGRFGTIVKFLLLARDEDRWNGQDVSGGRLGDRVEIVARAINPDGDSFVRVHGH